MRLKLKYELPLVQTLVAVALLVWTDRWERALMQIQDMPGTPPSFTLLIAINAPLALPRALLFRYLPGWWDDNSRCGDWGVLVLGVIEYQILAAKTPPLLIFVDTLETGGRHDSRWHRRDVGFRPVARSCIQPSSTPFVDRLVVVCSMHISPNFMVSGADSPIRTRFRSVLMRHRAAADGLRLM